MKLLLVLNENPAGSHDDVHRALARLVEGGELQSFYVYPYLARLADGLGDNEMLAEIQKMAEEYRPTAILWSHTSTLHVSEDIVKGLRDSSSKPIMGYWDADIYQSPYKPLPKAVINLVKLCDVSFWPGYGEMIETLRALGCIDMRYVPLSTDELRFGAVRPKEATFDFDVVMVANYVSSKIPWRTFPGSRWRKELAKYLFKKLGPRFAVFGYGWRGTYARGPIPFKEQNKIYHASRITLDVNNLHARYYFSNRLPIALSSGATVVSNHEEGIEEIFNQLQNPAFFRTTEQAWGIIERLLAKDQDELDDMALETREFALSRLTKTDIMKYIVSVLRSYKLAQDKKNGAIIQVAVNPWITIDQL